jgi:hypothetical protein
MPVIKHPEVCVRGYHLVTVDHLAAWLCHDCTIFEAEGRGAADVAPDKTAFSQARLVRHVPLSERSMRLFAADCAEHVLHLFEDRYPDDDRPRKAIETVRQYAAVNAYAYAATAAAVNAATAAAAVYAANDAATAAAAVNDADAAYAAAATERVWQGARLLDYLEGTV